MIFERFRQVDESRTRKYGGTGLGLSISKQLAEILGGELKVESIVGEGSVFTLKLPLSLVETKAEPENVELTIIPEPIVNNGDNTTILVAEDDLSSMQILKYYLKPMFPRILTASNGREAFDIFKLNNNIDLVLLDIQMPFLNGIEVSRKIRSINKNIPILAQTAYALADEQKMCLEAGCNDYISKPIRKEELLSKIGLLLNMRGKSN
jgi:CheY-like chemotaxis protein